MLLCPYIIFHNVQKLKGLKNKQKQKRTNLTFLLESTQCQELCYELELYYIICPHSNFELCFIILIFRIGKQVLG